VLEAPVQAFEVSPQEEDNSHSCQHLTLSQCPTSKISRDSYSSYLQESFHSPLQQNSGGLHREKKSAGKKIPFEVHERKAPTVACHSHLLPRKT